MLTFLRKIRKSLIESGSAHKYILYAIGEILLVVIGILIALQINNWNEWQKDRKKENAHLQEIEATIESNVLLLEARIQSINRQTSSGEIVDTFLKTRDQSIKITPEDWHWALMGRGDLTLSSAGYESLKSQGLELITNPQLKSQIINLFEYTYPELIRQQDWGNRVRPDYDQFIIEHFAINRGANGKSIFGKIPRDVVFLLDNHYFHGLIETAIAQRSFYRGRYQYTLEEAQKVLQLIKAELIERQIKN